MKINLSKALQESTLSQAAAAVAALANGWTLTTHEDVPGMPSHELLDIYERRREHLDKKPGKHARQLTASISELVEALKAHPVDSVQIIDIHGNEEHSFDVFVAEQHGKVLGCLKVISATEVTTERWAEIWSDSA